MSSPSHGPAGHHISWKAVLIDLGESVYPSSLVRICRELGTQGEKQQRQTRQTSRGHWGKLWRSRRNRGRGSLWLWIWKRNTRCVCCASACMCVHVCGHACAWRYEVGFGSNFWSSARSPWGLSHLSSSSVLFVCLFLCFLNIYFNGIANRNYRRKSGQICLKIQSCSQASMGRRGGGVWYSQNVYWTEGPYLEDRKTSL